MKLSNPSGGSVAGSPSPLVAVDASLYPDYPAGAVGDRLYIELGGKIGGVSGRAVETGDVVECLLANAGGSEAAVGSSWIAYEANIPGTTAAGTAMIQAADATAQAALLTTLLPLAGGTMTGALINSTNGAASAPPLLLSGTIFTGGTATTTKPALLIEPTGTTSTGWSTSGTLFGGNAPSGFAGALLDLQVNGTRKAGITAGGIIGRSDQGHGFFVDGGGASRLGQNQAANTGPFIGTSNSWLLGPIIGTSYGAASLGFSNGADITSADAILCRAAAATLQLGTTHATAATAQTLVSHSVTTGTGANMIIGAGTGSVAGGAVILATRATTGDLTARVTVAANGEVTIVLPTSAGTAGSLWNDTGTVKVA